jgi:type II secretory ATPase GspE/PulE/Tfp pilus assembly ATPase PilB-like protein
MTDQELARALVAKGVLSPQQVQQAAQQRGGNKTFAQIVVSQGWASMMEIIEIDADAFNLRREGVPGSATSSNDSAATQNAPRAHATAPDFHSEASTPAQPQARPMRGGTADSEYSAGEYATDELYAGLGQDEEPDIQDGQVIIQGEEDRQNDPSYGPIISYTNELLRIAVQLRASDMHLEPRAGDLLPRYRVDGHLRSGGPIPAELRAPITSRLKVLADLDISEMRLPQDGRFRATIGGRVFDFRVSTLPSIHGEKIVIRLLDRSALVTDLRRLGFTETMRETFEAMLRQSQGMILVTGPTGSGKTTTLYAALATTRDETKNVVTCEDPVEYELPGVTQTNINPEIGLSFATQLRAILRQDPDVILVGEIRDGEAADIAIRAALTGHLVLSTLHTNSAVAAVTRLQDMGVPPFLIASSLSCVIAQRLVRLICRNCREELSQDSPEYEAAIARLGLESGFPLFRGVGCEKCNGSGSRGRIAILELLVVDRETRRAIMHKTNSSELRDIAVRNGMRPLWQDGLDKLRNGLTTADEVARVLLGTEDAAEEDAGAQA